MLLENLTKMLKTKKIYYFDVDEFEDITAHYFDQGDYVRFNGPQIWPYYSTLRMSNLICFSKYQYPNYTRSL